MYPQTLLNQQYPAIFRQVFHCQREFKSTVSKTDMQLVVDAAYSLQQIEGVEDLNFGENTSPEGLNQGYTHSLTMKFDTAEDRDSVYLPHPIHQKFVKLFVPLTESVLVYDYWE